MRACRNHEWTKHGLCASDNGRLNSQLEYFSATLQLRKQFDLVAAFTQAGIRHGKRYRATELQRAITQAFGVSYTPLKCKNGALTEVQLCINKQLEIQDCPRALRSTCRGSVSF